MNQIILLDSIDDMTFENAEKIAFDGATVRITDHAAERIQMGRRRFESFMQRKGGYVYGSTTAPGSRAKRLLSEAESERQGETLRRFVPLRAGPSGEMLSDRCVKLAVFARLSNSLTGSGKLGVSTARSIAALIEHPPPVPIQATACSGEVLPLTWLAAPLADLPLAKGEAMALINGSPFSTAMICDAALTARRRLRLAEHILVMSIEAAGCPLSHFDRRLADHWPDPFYRQCLNGLAALLVDAPRNGQLEHQAPTSWRVLPNVLANALRAVSEALQSAQIGLRALKDNPTFIQADAADDDGVVSSGGFHDHRAAKALDGLNSALIDLSVLASKQVSHLLDGTLGLPPLLSEAQEGVGMEYFVWAMTEPLACAVRSGQSTTLNIGLQDPVGNQSDIPSLGVIAYGKYCEIVRSFDICFAALALTAARACKLRSDRAASPDTEFSQRIRSLASSAARTVDLVGLPWQVTKEDLRAYAEELSTTQFAQLLRRGMSESAPT